MSDTPHTQTATMTTTSTNPTLAKNLKNLRDKTGYTQDFVAKYLEVTRELISFYETGSRSVSASHLEKLSDLYHVEPQKMKREILDTETITIACAFRADGFEEEDLYALAWFQGVVKNYLRIKKIAAK